jgi:hypothetical protein
MLLEQWRPILLALQQIRARETSTLSIDHSGKSYPASKKLIQNEGDTYLGAGMRLTEGLRPKVLRHKYPLCERSDGVHSIIDFSFLQLIEGESGRVSTPCVVPHAVCSSGKGLYSALDEGAYQLEAGHLFFGDGSQLSNLLH